MYWSIQYITSKCIYVDFHFDDINIWYSYIKPSFRWGLDSFSIFFPYYMRECLSVIKETNFDTTQYKVPEAVFVIKWFLILILNGSVVSSRDHQLVCLIQFNLNLLKVSKLSNQFLYNMVCVQFFSFRHTENYRGNTLSCKQLNWKTYCQKSKLIIVSF